LPKLWLNTSARRTSGSDAINGETDPQLLARIDRLRRLHGGSRLRDCLVPMMQCVAVWAFASEQIFQNTGETQLVRDLRLKAFIDDADHKLVSKLGEIRTNPRAKPFEERYLGIRDEWNQFVKYRTRDQWTDGTSPLYKSVTNSLLQLAEYFSADCRSILRELNAPASIRRRSVRPVWKGVLNVQMQDATPKSVVERKSRRWRRQADD
jgi:hypothetical protein